MSAYLVIVVVIVIVLLWSSHAAPVLSLIVEPRAVASSPGVVLVGHHPGSLTRTWSGSSTSPSSLHPRLCSEVHGHGAWWREVLLLWDRWRRRHTHHQVWSVFRLKYNETISRTVKVFLTETLCSINQVPTPQHLLTSAVSLAQSSSSATAQ